MGPVKVYNGHGRLSVGTGGFSPALPIVQRFALNRDCIAQVRDCFPAVGRHVQASIGAMRFTAILMQGVIL